MEKQRRLKVIILSTLIVGILTLTIAFSALSRTLNIDGVGKMDTATWDVHFENLSDAKITRDAIEVGKPNISIDKGTVENINVKLTNPKDEIKYVVDIVNKGTIDAEVNIMTISDLTDEQKKLIDFGVYYLNGNKINKFDLLEPEDVKSIVIKIRYKDDITEFDLPSEPLEIKLSCQIEYIQSNAEMVITPENNLENVKSVLTFYNYFVSPQSTFLHGTLPKDKVETISFLSTLKVPLEARTTAWDASEAKDGSVVAWYTDIDNNGLNEVYIGGNGVVYANKSCARLFSNFINLEEINFNGNFDTTDVKSLFAMFASSGKLKELDLSFFNTSKVTDMSYMFSSCSNLVNLDISSFNTSNVTDVSHMFSRCTALTNLNISHFDTKNVTTMEYLFYECTSLPNLNLSNFNTSSVTNMSSMFSGCSNLQSLDLSNFNTESVLEMEYMFCNCKKLNDLNLKSFNTSNVTNMYGMFMECNVLESLDLSSFDTSNLISMYQMFSRCYLLKNINLSNASFDGEITNSIMFNMVPKGFTIAVKDQETKNFVLSIRNDADVIIGSPTA